MHAGVRESPAPLPLPSTDYHLFTLCAKLFYVHQYSVLPSLN